ncbi:PepSY domain-containing protein, partial [Pseudomonas putida]|nr:PepSY domain-containing protein [Pseudomonas putida]
GLASLLCAGLGVLGAVCGAGGNLRLGVEATGLALGLGLAVAAWRVACADGAPAKRRTARRVEVGG